MKEEEELEEEGRRRKKPDKFFPLFSFFSLSSWFLKENDISFFTSKFSNFFSLIFFFSLFLIIFSSPNIRIFSLVIFFSFLDLEG